MNLGCRGSSWKGTCWKPASPAQSRRLLKQSCLALPRQCVKSHICGAKVSASRTTHLHYARNERGFSYHTPKSGLIKYGSTYGPNDGLWLAGLLSPPSESKPSLSSGAISRPWLGCTARKAMGVASGIPNASNFSLKGGTFLYPIQESVIVVFLRRQSSASRSGYGNRMERHFEVVEQNTRCAVERRRYAARRPRPRIPQFQGELLNTNRATNSMLGILSMGLLTWQLQAEVGEALPSLRVIEVGAHQRIWNTGDGHAGRSVVEIGSGMNYWDGQQWVPSDPSFEVTADAFVAERLQHKVHLKANLNKVGAVTVTTCDGITLRSTPVGIGLYDAASGRSAVIAAITDCAGVLVSSNKVVYENAFSGVCADVIYTIDRGSFEQDVLIRGRLD